MGKRHIGFRKNFAFTLAEVLITLGIIGIVAAMVIPSLLNAFQKHVTVTRLKQTYAQITQAVKLSEVDNGDFTGWDLSKVSSHDFDIESSERVAKTYFIPYMKYTYLCTGKNTYCASYSRKKLSGASDSYSTYYHRLHGLVLQNGVVIHFWPRGSTTMEIVIDINAASGSNTWGKDVFSIVVQKSKGNGIHTSTKTPAGIYLYGEGFSREKMLNNGYGCNKTGQFAGLYCGALIKEDGWKISKDYPW